MISRFVFEDSKAAALSKLFCLSYPNSSHIHYAAGSNNIAEIINQCLIDSEEMVVVFLDCVPDNPSTVKTYEALRSLSTYFNYRCIVLPIVCAEYYYLKSLPAWALKAEVRQAVGRCIAKEWYKNEELLKNHSPRSCSNFERYCKLLCEEAPVHCASIKRKGSTKEEERPYIYKDCPCEMTLSTCSPIPLLEKSRRYLRAYPCIPGGSVHKAESLSSEELWQLHRSLVEEFNTWVDKFAQADPNANYMHIRYIK